MLENESLPSSVETSATADVDGAVLNRIKHQS